MTAMLQPVEGYVERPLTYGAYSFEQVAKEQAINTKQKQKLVKDKASKELIDKIKMQVVQEYIKPYVAHAALELDKLVESGEVTIKDARNALIETSKELAQERLKQLNTVH